MKLYNSLKINNSNNKYLLRKKLGRKKNLINRILKRMMYKNNNINNKYSNNSFLHNPNSKIYTIKHHQDPYNKCNIKNFLKNSL